MYVQDPSVLMGGGAARDRLIELVDSRVVTDIVPYGLGPHLETESGRLSVATWIDDLHAHGARVIVPIAHPSRLLALDVLFGEQPHSYVDALITEYEFWNVEDRLTAFATMVALVAEMRARGTRWGNRALRVGAYLGYPTADEAARLATELDFVFLDYSVTAPERAWTKVYPTRGSLRARFAWFVRAGIDAWPIFYAIGEVDMRPVLKNRGIAAVERTFSAAAAADPDLSRFPPAGFVYFTFEAMP